MRKVIGPALLIILLITALFKIHEIDSVRESSGNFYSVTQEIGPLNSTLCCRKTQVAWLLKCKWIGMPVSDVWGFCDSLKVEYIACTSFEMNLRPGFFQQAMNGETGNYHEFKSSDYYKIFKRNS